RKRERILPLCRHSVARPRETNHPAAPGQRSAKAPEKIVLLMMDPAESMERPPEMERPSEIERQPELDRPAETSDSKPSGIPRRLILIIVASLVGVLLLIWGVISIQKPGLTRGLKLIDTVVHLPTTSFTALPVVLPCEGTL